MIKLPIKSWANFPNAKHCLTSEVSRSPGTKASLLALSFKVYETVDKKNTLAQYQLYKSGLEISKVHIKMVCKIRSVLNKMENNKSFPKPSY